MNHLKYTTVFALCPQTGKHSLFMVSCVIASFPVLLLACCAVFVQANELD